MGNWKFSLGEDVTIEASGESGKVIGRAEYLDGSPSRSYLIHYKAADGRAVETWWRESALGCP